MNKFIKLQNATYGEYFYTNLNCIAYFCPEGNTIFISGVHGDGNGIMRITSESSDILLEAIKGAVKNDTAR